MIDSFAHKRNRAGAAVVRRPAEQAMRHWLTGLMLLALLSLLSAGGAAARQTPDSFADLAERLLPAVVNISTTQTMDADRMPEMPQFPPGSPFEDFFKEFFDRQMRPDTPRKATSLGSGFIIDPAGLVVTNNHVIADADEINVILHDNAAYTATVVGRDTKTDLALLKIEPRQPLPAVSFGNSDEMRVGDWVLAIGNPFGLGGTVTAGIISARARDINAGPYDDFLQTDASINRGNSGGPMFNIRGEVIGINTAIYSPSGGSIGIGFAIPASLARTVIADLRQYGKTRRGWLGVRIQSVTEEIAESLALSSPKGALVASVSEGGPAAKAGIKAGDVILTFNGREVDEMKRLPRIVAETEIGKRVPVTVWRDGREVQVPVEIGLLEDEEEVAEAPAKPAPGKDKAEAGQSEVPALGVTVAALTPALRERFNIAEETKGVVVTDVGGRGPAAEKGIRPGDVIVEISQEAVASPKDVQNRIDAARKAGRRSVLMLVENDRGLRFVAIRLEENGKKK